MPRRCWPHSSPSTEVPSLAKTCTSSGAPAWADLLYHLTLTDPAGHALWLHETSDTAVAPPPNVSLTPGRTYYWYVDALDAGGSSLTTGTRRFMLGP